jgi:subtilase family serine protease
MARSGLLCRGSALATALAAACALAVAQSAAAGSTQPLTDTKPGWATTANDAGDASSRAKMVFSVWLGWRNRDELEQLLAAQQDESSPLHGQWLSPGEFRARFAPDRSEVEAVKSWLRSQGFSFVDVPRNNLFVAAEGTVAQVESAFAVQEHLYSVEGRLVIGPDRDPRIPSSLAPTVEAVTGLDTAFTLATPQHRSPAPPPPTGTSVGPCSHYWGEATSTRYPNPFAPGEPLPWLICGYTPAQIASAYGIDNLWQRGIDGSGQTIAITGAFFSPTIRQDIRRFSRLFGLPRPEYREVVAPGTVHYPRDPADVQSWYIEQSLDVEWAHAVAPHAKIVYVGAANDSRGLDLALNEVVDNHLANVISNSWGMPESDASAGEIRALRSIFEQAEAEGIGIYFASGDGGDNLDLIGKVSGGFPSSSPLVTSVGGTSLAVDRSGARMWETAWGTTEMNWNGSRWADAYPGYFLYGGGGGVSHVYDQPDYQRFAVPFASAYWKGRLRRAEPDVALVSDPQTGVLFSQTWSTPGGGTEQKESWIGGTSLATPIMAGIAALADESAGRPHGFLNPAIYRLRRSGIFSDIRPTVGNLAVLRNRLLPNGRIATMLRSLDRDSSLRSAPGWDDVTGLGSPRADALVEALGH